MRLVLAPKHMEGINEKLIKSWDQKSGQKYLRKTRKWKTFQHIEIGDSIQTHGCIVANQGFTRCGNRHNILPLFGGLEGSLTFSPLLSYTMKLIHTSQKTTMARGWERDGWMLASQPALGVLFIGKLMTKLHFWPNTTKTVRGAARILSSRCMVSP
jgi:hypothetical protein